MAFRNNSNKKEKKCLKFRRFNAVNFSTMDV